jgi:hypothetical protein
MSAVIPRGIRNNNPGNIRQGVSPWVGMTPDQPDPEFVTFIDPQHGIRAIVRIMKTYEERGINTIAEAINHWAPTVENDTTAYINAVCAGCSVTMNQPVDFNTIMPQLIKAIILHENGEQPYSDDIINQGIALA